MLIVPNSTVSAACWNGQHTQQIPCPKTKTPVYQQPTSTLTATAFLLGKLSSNGTIATAVDKDALTKTIAAIDAAIRSLVLALKNLEDQLTLLRSELDALMTSHADPAAIASIQDQINSVQDQISTVQNQISLLRTQLKSLLGG